jgi:hypothetical protein
LPGRGMHTQKQLDWPAIDYFKCQTNGDWRQNT